MVDFTFSDLLGAAVDLARRNYGRFLATQGVFVLLGGLLSVGASFLLLTLVLDAVEVGERLADPGTVPPEEVAQAMAQVLLATALFPLVLSLLSGFFGLVGTFFGLGTAEAAQRGEAPTSGGLWRRWGGRFGPFFLTALAAGVLPGLLVAAPMLLLLRFQDFGVLAAVSVLTLVLLPVAIVLWLRWYLAPALALYDGLGVQQSLHESGRRMRGRYVTVGAALLVVGLAGALVASVVVFPLALVTGGPAFQPFSEEPLPSLRPYLASLVVQQVGGMLVSVAFAPIYAALLAHAHGAARPPPPTPPAPPASGPPTSRVPVAPPPSGAPPAGEARFCARCGAARGVAASFCAVCGTPFAR